MPETSQALAGLDRLRLLSEQAVVGKGRLSPAARQEAARLLAELWVDQSILPAKILDAAERIRGSDVASSLSIWPSLSEQRRQAIVKSMAERPIEATGRNIYASAEILPSDPGLAVDLLVTARDNKENAERVHAALLKQNAERVRAFGSAQSAQHKIRNVFRLLMSALHLHNYTAGCSADRAVVRTLVEYIGRNRLSADSTFGELLDNACARIREWPIEYKRSLAVEIAEIDQQTLRRCLPDQIPTELAPQPSSQEPTLQPAIETPLPASTEKGSFSDFIANLRDRAVVARHESSAFRMQSQHAEELADLLEKVAQNIEVAEQDRKALEQAQRVIDESHRALLATQQALDRAEAAAKMFRDENGELRAGLEGATGAETLQAKRASELAERCQELEQALDQQRAKELEQMQRYGQARLEEFRRGLARSLHPSIHDLPQTLSGLTPDLTGVVAIRLEQVIRELERHDIPVRTWREKS